MPMQPYLAGTGPEFVDCFEPHWREAWERHTPAGPIAFLTICSHAKPYSKSHIHSEIRRRLWEHGLLGQIDYAHISNAGIVPASAEMDYPFCAYDWNVAEASEEDIAYHIETTTKRLRDWYAKHGKHYFRVVAYLREGGHTITAMRAALPEAEISAAHSYIGFRLRYAAAFDVDDCLLDPRNLNRLVERLKA